MTPLPERREALLALAERCEKATGPSAEERQLVIDAYNLIFPHEMTLCEEDRGDEGTRYRRTMHRVQFTTYANTDYNRASLDAAMTLVPEGCLFEVHKMGGQWAGMAQVNGVLPFRHLTSRLRAATPALALCAAALRARSQTPSGGGQ